MRTVTIRIGVLFLWVLLVPAVQAASVLFLNGENCGVIESLVIDQPTQDEQYDVKITGDNNCGPGAPSGGGVSLPYNSLALTVDGGSSASVDVFTGVVAQLPVEIVLEQTPDSLGNTIKNDAAGTITFNASTVSQTTTDEIRFYLKGGDGGQSPSVTINLTVNEGGSVGTATCVDNGDQLVCKGTNPKLVVGGNIQDVAMAKDAIHVWEFKYQNNAYGGAETIINLDPSNAALQHLEIDFTINQQPGNMGVGVGGQADCIRQANWIGISNYTLSTYCQLVEGQTYFLNMQNKGRKTANGTVPTSGYYTLVR